MHYQAAQLLEYFTYDHLPENLQSVSKPFYKLAHEVANRSPNNLETVNALRKLLESKDAAVRAALK